MHINGKQIIARHAVGIWATNQINRSDDGGTNTNVIHKASDTHVRAAHVGMNNSAKNVVKQTHSGITKKQR